MAEHCCAEKRADGTVEILSAKLRAALNDPKSKPRLEGQEFEVVASPWQDADAWQRAEPQCWAQVVAAAKIKLD